MKKSEYLKKYFHGQCSPEEIEYLLNHLQPEDVESYQMVIKDLWEEFNNHPALESSVSERMYQNILEKGKFLSVSSEGERPAIRQKQNYLFQKFAAVFIGLVVLTAGTIFIFINGSKTEYKTAYGEKKEVLLPDSSIVTLNSNSSLTFDKSQFAGDTREVRISGEAYFDVKKRTVGNKKAKFIVHTDDITVEVLGTRFNVNSRRAQTEVVLETGKIRLSIADDVKKEILMQPGDLVAYSSKNKELEHKIVLPKEYSNWLDNKLSFNGATLEHIAQEIEDHFGYKVVLENPNLKSKQYRGTFPSENIEIFLKSLSRSFDLEVVRVNEEIILKDNSSDTE